MVVHSFSVQRGGRETEEFLVQHSFYRTIEPSGVTNTAVVLRDPLPLQHGKSSLAQFAATKAWHLSSRQMGHTGLSISHYSFDRAGYSSSSRLLKQHHRVLEATFQAPVEGKDSSALALLEWVASSPLCPARLQQEPFLGYAPVLH